MLVLGIIVAYHTEVVLLESILAALTAQCSFVLADNSEDACCSNAIRACVERHAGIYVPMGGNQGIGAAQNAAIATAWRAGADAVLLLDDDSIPAANLLTVLAACRSPTAGEHAVFCANALDAQGCEISNVRHRKGAMPLCREMMSSGSLVRRRIFDTVGLFDATLFIDCVDFEWGWRAQSKGVAIHVCRGTAITHRLGQGRVGGIRVASPIRHYYQFRNILRMMPRRYVPLAWRISQAVKLPLKLLLIGLLMPERARRIRYALAGVRDALRRRGGKQQPPTTPMQRHSTQP